MTTTSERDTASNIDVQVGDEPEAPYSAEEYGDTLEVIEVGGEELSEVFAHCKPPADAGGSVP